MLFPQVVEPAKLQLQAGMPTLFFMPHCETTLLERVLSANIHQRQQIAVFGNSFRKVAETWHGRLHSSACAVVSVGPADACSPITSRAPHTIT